jgi:hypothetical protein
VILAMMFKESFRALNMEMFGVTALVIFVAVFVSMAIWAGVQRREEVKRWSDLPLADDAGGRPDAGTEGRS